MWKRNDYKVWKILHSRCVLNRNYVGGYEDEEASEEEDEVEDTNEKRTGQRSSTTTKHRKVASSEDEHSDQEQETKRKRVQSEDEEESDWEISEVFVKIWWILICSVLSEKRNQDWMFVYCWI